MARRGDCDVGLNRVDHLARQRHIERVLVGVIGLDAQDSAWSADCVGNEADRDLASRAGRKGKGRAAGVDHELARVGAAD